MTSTRRRSQQPSPHAEPLVASDLTALGRGADAARIPSRPLRGLAWVVPESLVAPVPSVPDDLDDGRAPPAPPARPRFFARAERLAVVIDLLRVALIRDDQERPVVWSIDCGTGEDLFSVAIAASEELGPLATRLRFVGSDPDAAMISAARAAVYELAALRGVPEPIVQRHFERVAADRFAVAEAHREQAEFHEGEIEQMAAGLPPRSVLVALAGSARGETSAAALSRIHREIADRLVPGGFLVQPPTAPTPDPSVLERWDASEDGVFVKRAPPARSAPPIPSRERPITVRPDAAVSTVPARPRDAGNDQRLSDAVELSDRGEIEAALHLTTEALRLEPNGPLGYLVRAQLQLAGGSVGGALDDLRRLLFLAPECRLARYWYVLVLRAARMPERALVQLDQLELCLEHATDEDVLEDDVATVGDLRAVLGGLRTRLLESMLPNNQGESS